MTRRRKTTLAAVVLAVIAAATVVLYRVNDTVNHLPEAYAAWDTGELLVEYLETHDNQWPTSWDDLLSVVDTSRGSDLILRAPHANDSDYAQALQSMVAIDWSFDPANPGNTSPVTRLDGSEFPVLWQDADPNEMVREYLESSASNDH